MVAWIGASLPLTLLTIALGDRVTNVPITLSYTTTLPCAVAELGDIDLRNGNRDEAFTLTPNQFTLRHVLAQIFFDFTAYDLTKATEVTVYTFHGHRHMLCVGEELVAPVRPGVLISSYPLYRRERKLRQRSSGHQWPTGRCSQSHG